MKLSVCIDSVLRGRELEESLQTVKRLGYDTIEFWSWWDKDLGLLQSLNEQLELTVSCFCTRFISLVDESLREAYLTGLAESIEAARRLGCTRLITQTGGELAGVPREEQRRSLIEGLRACVPLLEEAGVTLLVEPLNLQVDHPGYFLARSDEAFSIIEEVESAHVKVLYDIYHQQITEGNLISTIRRHIGSIGHFHAAGHPGRAELSTGEIRYESVLAAIRDAGYAGFVGLEYFPQAEPETGLREALVYEAGGF
jgi:hydroxypyruvate isomerase